MDMLIEFAKMGIGISCVVKRFVELEFRNGLTDGNHLVQFCSAS